MNNAIILAAGSGSRMLCEQPKQFVEVAGKMLIEYSIEQFQTHPLIDEIAVVVAPNHVEKMSLLLRNGSYSKFKKVIIGGSERYHSSLAAIKAYDAFQDSNLLIHDAARPLVSHRIITKVIEGLAFYNGAVVAVPVTDTILQSDEHHCIAEIPSRKSLYDAQTPQGFKWRTIHRAFELGMQDPDFSSTDDSGVVHRYLPEEQILIVEGESRNRKITYHDDLIWLKEMVCHEIEK